MIARRRKKTHVFVSNTAPLQALKRRMENAARGEQLQGKMHMRCLPQIAYALDINSQQTNTQTEKKKQPRCERRSSGAAIARSRASYARAAAAGTRRANAPRAGAALAPHAAARDERRRRRAICALDDAGDARARRSRRAVRRRAGALRSGARASSPLVAVGRGRRRQSRARLAARLARVLRLVNCVGVFRARVVVRWLVYLFTGCLSLLTKTPPTLRR
jgi:hypothetical protein